MANPRRHLALIALFAVITHATALRCGFIWLDHAHIEDGLAVAPLPEWLALFAGGFAGTGFYRPIMALSLSLDAALGQGAWLYHATSVLWHAGASVLTCVAATALGAPRRAAIAAGILFAVHPLSSLVASAVAFRSEAMIAVALLAFIVLHRRVHVAAGLALLLGALTKETVLVLGPMIIVALELDGPSPRPPLSHRIHVWASEATALGAALGLRFMFAPSWRATWAPLSFSEALGTRFASLAKSAARALVPIDVNVCDSFPLTPLGSAQALLGVGVAGAAACLAYRRRGPALLLAIALLPSLQLVPVMRWWSPHYLYVPFAFAAMLIGEWVTARSTAVQRVAVAGASLLATVSFAADLRFENDATLWTAEVRAQPACREGHFYLGEVAREERRWDDAAASYQRAITATPGMMSYVDRIPALQNLGVVRLEQGRWDEARSAFRIALAIAAPGDERRHLLHNLATTELRSGNAEEAARLLETEVARSDALPASIVVRARAVETLGRTDEARALMRRLQSRLPGAR
ncbi:MAG TPA: tetratricopeptide repeat protein [Polyangiaceae bacterium]|nr:tetratricopeptide repeat protein [Polyangiaceae bacterium]